MRFLLVIAAVLATGCDPETPPGGPPVLSDEDAGPASAARLDATPSSEKARPISELAGTWRGTGDSPEHGAVTAQLVASEDGQVVYRVIGKAHTVSDRFRVTAWTGKRLHIKDQRGELSVSARLRDGVMTITAPTLGQLRFERMSTGR